MPAFDFWITAAQWLNAFVFGAVALRLHRLRLREKYRVFFWYLSFSTLRSAALLVFDYRSAAYFFAWLFTEPVLWVMNILMIRELFSLVLARHKGIGQLGRWLFHGALLLAISISTVSLLPEGTGGLPGKSTLLMFMFVVTRCVSITVLVFVLALVAFLNWYPVSLSRNVIRHSVTFAAYSLFVALAFFARALTGDALLELTNLCLVVFSALAASFWLTLRQAGEQEKLKLRSHWTSSDETVLLSNLDALNNQLLRVARK
jgi:hypothetical protein